MSFLLLTCLCKSGTQSKVCLFPRSVRCSSRPLDEVICVHFLCTYQVFTSHRDPKCCATIESGPLFIPLCLTAFDMLSAWKFTAACHSSCSNLLMCHSESRVMNKHADVQRDEIDSLHVYEREGLHGGGRDRVMYQPPFLSPLKKKTQQAASTKISFLPLYLNV